MFDVDARNVRWGFGGGLYFSQMDGDGGICKHSGNKAGAKYGTGYCKPKCPRNIKLINGQQGSDTNPGTGFGCYGTCCNEIDIREANSYSTASIANPCTVQEQTRCSGSEYTSCCHSDGCDFNPYRLGNLPYYGHNMTVDTNKKPTVITQFITADNTTTSALGEIRRLYIQNGKVVQNARSSIPELAGFDSIAEEYCSAQKAAFGDPDVCAKR
ncbi:hypothetical protein RSOLAG22IIIB_06543 [Rhizoctonia solani]|uniref:Glucanase n=1 Tax=Rhizoctonia solani TaxID=456999 RepID=A0A0K6GFL3_9AGAM|nr:hypothetical protein RSOLAG22IIIB_06543 [Rhizoctonia solani]